MTWRGRNLKLVLAAAAALLIVISTSIRAAEKRAICVNAIADALPIRFEPSQGAVRFVSRGAGYSLAVTDAGPVIRTLGSNKRGSSSTVGIRFVGGKAHARTVGEQQLKCRSNYFVGNDRTKWRTGIPNYAKVRSEGIYPGIDVVYFGANRSLEYDLIVSPGADPNRIRLRFQGTKVGLSPAGDLILRGADGKLTQKKPRIYQETDGKKAFVQGRYVMARDGTVSVRLGSYDRSKPLIIDPVVIWYSAFGGSAVDRGRAVAVDNQGYAYITGFTISNDFPILNAYQPTRPGNTEAFITKIDTTTNNAVYSTFLGGNQVDTAYGIAVDSTGAAYVAGYTTSSNFPIANAAQPVIGGGVGTFRYDAFVTKLSPDGSYLMYSTYLGGANNEIAYGIALDSSDNAYVTGYSQSNGASGATPFPTTVGCYQSTMRGTIDCFLTKISSSGNTFLYSTLFGGSTGSDNSYSVAVDSLGRAYVTGYTLTTDFPTVNAIQGTNGGLQDAFVARFDATGSTLDYSTYLGGTGADNYSIAGTGQYPAVAVDSSFCAYITGFTNSTNFPVTANALQPTSGGGYDAFAAKLDASGTQLLFCTYLGGSGGDWGGGICLDAAGNVYVVGATASANFPTVSAVQSAPSGGNDIFVTSYANDGLGYIFSTYVGTALGEVATGAAVSPFDNRLVVTGDYAVTVPSNYDAVFLVIDPFMVTSITPESGPNNEIVVTEVRGLAFRSGTDVKLSKTGFSDLEAEPVVVAPGGATMAATLDLVGQKQRTCDVVVKRPDNATLIVPNGFEITRSHISDLNLFVGELPYIGMAGVSVEHLINVTNNGPDESDDAVATCTIPPGAELSYVQAFTEDLTPATWTVSGNVLTIDFGHLANGAVGIATVVILPSSPGTITTDFAASGTEADPNPDDNTFTYDTEIRPFEPTTLERVSLGPSGAEGNGHSSEPSVSADGRFVAFRSTSDNLVSNDVYGGWDVFVRDRLLGTTELISKVGGVQSNADSGYPSMSAGGRYIAWDTLATNLVPSDTDDYYDVYVTDRDTGQATMISYNSTTGEKGNHHSRGPRISADGRLVVFESRADNLVANDTNESWDCFLHDCQTHTTTRISLGPNGEQGNGDSRFPFISDDGRWVGFTSAASNLVPGDTNAHWDIFLRDLQTGQTRRLTMGYDGQQSDGDSYWPAVSANGRYIIFPSVATNLVEGDTNGFQDIFVCDSQTGRISCASVSPIGEFGNAMSGEEWVPETGLQYCTESVSENGFAVFASQADNLVPDDTNYREDVFLRDLVGQKTTRLSTYSFMEGTLESFDPFISPNGRFIVFPSLANDLVPSDLNDAYDIFLYDQGADLEVSCTASPDPSIVGFDLTYTITVTNKGPADATNVVITDTLPTGTVFVSTSTGGRPWNRTGNIFTCNIGALSVGASATITVVVKPASMGLYTNSVSVAGTEPDRNQSNNSATVTNGANLPGINCGGPVIGNWVLDYGFVGGRTLLTTTPVSNTASVPQQVYQTQRYGVFDYKLPTLPNGTYRLRLHFVEALYSAQRMRIFSVYQGSRVLLSNFDVFKEAGGRNKAMVKEFTITISDGKGLWLKFTSQKVNATISGIDILRY